MFTDASHALNWAYDTASRPIVKMSAINHMRRESISAMPNPLLLDLDAQDRHEQAAMITGMVEKLPYREETEYLKARFGRMVSPGDLTIVVYRGCEALGVGLEKQEAVYRVIKSYFGGYMSFRYVRQTLGCRHQHAVMSKRCLYDVLDVINDQAMADISRELEQHGLIRNRCG